MKIRAQCVPCLLTRGFYECRTFLQGREDAGEIEARAMRAGLDEMYENYDPSVCSAIIATKVHRAIYQGLGTDDPYKDIKDRSNKVALDLVPKAKEYIEMSEDKLEAAVMVSVVGNLMDFGIEGVIDSPEALEKVFDEIVQHGLDVNHLDSVKEYLKPGAKILYLPDNAGEIIFDALTVKVLRSMGCQVTVMVKGAPILTDVTMEDAQLAGMEEAAHRIITTGSNAIGLDVNDMDEEAKDALFNSDLVISKGMANYEALSEPEYKETAPILYVLRTKCLPVAEDLGVGKDQNIAFLYTG